MVIFRTTQPVPCILCASPSPLKDGLCDDCLALLPRLPLPRCRCGIPLPAGEEYTDDEDTPPPCGRCLDRPPPFRMVVAPWAWGFPLDRLVGPYKYRGVLVRERPLVRLAEAGLRELDPPRPDALVPIPLHWARRWRRGFNQAQRLAQGVGKRMDIPCLPALRRIRSTPRQQGLRAGTRRRNLHRAFRVDGDVEGLHLALVDDVVTTGSTAREASKLLLDAGATCVDVWALARVLPGGGA